MLTIYSQIPLKWLIIKQFVGDEVGVPIINDYLFVISSTKTVSDFPIISVKGISNLNISALLFFKIISMIQEISNFPMKDRSFK